MADWQPATIADVKEILANDLPDCDCEQLAAYKLYAIEPHLAPIMRYGGKETVFVVARNGSEVMYWEDVEEGFNISPVGPNGEILEHWCNQDELRFALNGWIPGRDLPTKYRPAQPLSE